MSLEEEAERQQEEDRKRLDPKVYKEIVAKMRDWMPQKMRMEILELIEKEGIHKWAIPFHFEGGMMIRNKIREWGYTEAAVGIENWDNIYISIIEDVVML